MKYQFFRVTWQRSILMRMFHIIKKPRNKWTQQFEKPCSGRQLTDIMTHCHKAIYFRWMTPINLTTTSEILNSTCRFPLYRSSHLQIPKRKVILWAMRLTRMCRCMTNRRVMISIIIIQNLKTKWLQRILLMTYRKTVQ